MEDNRRFAGQKSSQWNQRQNTNNDRLDIDVRRRLSDIIEKATPKSGSFMLDRQLLNEIKSIVKQSNTNVKIAYDILFQQLKSNSSLTRYLTLFIVDELFLRSKYFRSLLVEEFKEFMELTLGTHGNALPPPAENATLLRDKSLSAIENWFNLHGKHLKPLALGYHYLKNTLKLKLSAIGSANEDHHKKEKEARSQALLKIKYSKIKEESKESFPDMINNLNQMESCFDILVPQVDDIARNQSLKASKESNTDEDEEAQRGDRLNHDFGLGSRQYELNVEVPKTFFIENEENSPIFENLRGCYKIMVHRHQPLLKEWTNVLIKVELEWHERAEHDRLLKKVIDLNNSFLDVERKCQDLNIVLDPKQTNSVYVSTFQDEDGNEMVVVPIAEIKDDEKTPKKENSVEDDTWDDQEENDNFGSPFKRSKSADFTTSNETTPIKSEKEDQISPPNYKPHFFKSENEIKTEDNSPSKASGEKESRNELLMKAPVVPYFPGLYYWGKSEIALGDGIEREHRFFGSSDAPTLDIKNAQDITMRHTFYQPNSDFNPAKRTVSKAELLEEQKRKHVKLLEESPDLKEATIRQRLKKKLQRKSL